jgi:hypothetical protein
MSFNFSPDAESGGGAVNAAAVFTPEALATITTQGQVVVSFEYPGAEIAAITFKSNQ